MDNYVYKLGDTNYINLTNRCTCNCTFCIRGNGDGVGGYGLWLEKEPTAQQVIDLLAKDKTDIVFCGYGEPTMRLDTLLDIAAYAKSYGGHVRVDTNGHGSVYNGRDIVPEMAGKVPPRQPGVMPFFADGDAWRGPLVDEVSISLNAADAETYAKLTVCDYGEKGFDAMLEFAKRCIEEGIKTTLSVVDIIDEEEIEAAGKIAQKIGADFRVRGYVE